MTSEAQVTLRTRYMLPLVDLFNHAVDSLLPVAGGSGAGPAVEMIVSANATEWRCTREVAEGEAVTWSYGSLSTRDLCLHYGFVPEPVLHAHSSAIVDVSWPAMLLFADRVSAGLPASQGGWGLGASAAAPPLSVESAMAKREVVAALVLESCLLEPPGPAQETNGLNREAQAAEALVRIPIPPPGGRDAADSGAGIGLLLSLSRLMLAKTEGDLDAIATSMRLLEPGADATCGNFFVARLSDENEAAARAWAAALLLRAAGAAPDAVISEFSGVAGVEARGEAQVAPELAPPDGDGLARLWKVRCLLERAS